LKEIIYKLICTAKNDAALASQAGKIYIAISWINVAL
jgi:hypothetical protein